MIEGAGSVSELNLREHDLVNLWLATALRAPWLLVADIERGGVFASVIGTVQLLTPDERALFRGFAINKFRGDLSLFDEGVRMLEARTGARCLGVFPYADDRAARRRGQPGAEHGDAHASAAPARGVAIVRFPQLSNATDFRLLTWADWITLPPARAVRLHHPARQQEHHGRSAHGCASAGLADWILEQHRRGATVIGICGGYQMLGRTIRDPDGMESSAGQADGLGLLPAVTVLARDKTTRAVTATTPGGVRFGALRDPSWDHHARSAALNVPFARLDDGDVDGVRSDRRAGHLPARRAREPTRVCRDLRDCRAGGACRRPAGISGWPPGSPGTHVTWTTSVWRSVPLDTHTRPR